MFQINGKHRANLTVDTGTQAARVYTMRAPAPFTLDLPRLRSIWSAWCARHYVERILRRPLTEREWCTFYLAIRNNRG